LPKLDLPRLDLPSAVENQETLMRMVDMLEAASSLPRLVTAIEQGQERQIVITRDGRPVAMLVPIYTLPVAQRIEVAKGELEMSDDIDAFNEELANLFRREKS